MQITFFYVFVGCFFKKSLQTMISPAMLSNRNQCYCCPTSAPPTTPKAEKASNKKAGGHWKDSQISGGHWAELDRALNELGMLSTIAEGQREFIKEQRKKRDRNNSEPSSAVKDNSLSALTPLNSPVKPNVTNGYQLVQMNPAFVTCVNPSANISTEFHKALRSPRRPDTPMAICRTSSGAASYLLNEPSSYDLELQARLLRVSRSRIALRRHRRGHQPYHIKGQRSRINSSPKIVTSAPEWPEMAHTITKPSADECCSTRSVSDKPLSRSRSLDEIDFAKLCIREKAEREKPTACNRNSLDGRDMDSVSHQFGNLHVQ